MTSKAQRIAIAEVCGWKRVIGETGYSVVWREGLTKSEEHPGWFIGRIPDYLTDLNAMHEAEKAVIYPRSLAMVYLNKLQDVANDLSPAKFDDTSRTLYCSSATAAQRAEAFLRTLNLWKDQSS